MIDRLHKALLRCEDGLLVLLLFIMISTAVGQIIMRNIFGSGIIWADAMVRVLVLWLGLLGAMVATRNNNHINIDLLTSALPAKAKEITSAITLFFTSAICGLTAFYASRFVKMEWDYQSPGFANIPAWLCEAIIPLAFAVMALRCLLLAGNAIYHIFHPPPSSTDDPSKP